MCIEFFDIFLFNVIIFFCYAVQAYPLSHHFQYIPFITSIISCVSMMSAVLLTTIDSSTTMRVTVGSYEDVSSAMV